MKTLYAVLAAFCLAVLGGRAAAAPLETLHEARCVPIARSPVAVPLPADWRPFADETRVCPLRRTRRDDVSVFLVSVFAREYLDRHPEVKNRPAFPQTRLIDPDGRCLAQLPELFPFDPPRDLTVRYGAWKSNVPTEIRVLVANPAMGGDYELPRLHWDADAKIYRPKSATDPSTPESSRCPT